MLAKAAYSMNYLVENVLVHEKAGTTRDYIEHDIRIKSNWVTIVDTAGIHESTNSVEMAG